MFTPAEGKSLAENVNGEPASGDFNYSSMVVMLLYLSGHMSPNITLVVNYFTRYMFLPKPVHEHALQIIGHYLTAYSDKCLIMKPSEKLLKIDRFPDVDYARMYEHEAIDDLLCVQSSKSYLEKLLTCGQCVYDRPKCFKILTRWYFVAT